ncbi:hypothetical protein FA95DRAFT_1682874 [Auriscalpium vulgare]|uniref:Uncharacterized protein n=1 Tax=Auriscalpium vulgare TaxID=40419 RepID=A0ACB8RD10_9AGAM|nr:hypothetical protein FA95DRAFT_1682874 [Auriscalpium vulgare]
MMLKPFIHDPVTSEPELTAYERLLITSGSNPAQVVKRAKEGSTAAFQALAMHCAEVPTIQIPTVINMFCAGLDARNIPHSLLAHQDPTPSALSALSRAVSGFIAIERLTYTNPSQPLFLPQFARKWDGIYQWTVFFNDIYPFLADEDKVLIYDVLGQAITALELYGPTRKVVRDTPGVFALISSIWAKYTPPRKGCVVRCHPSFLSRLLQNLLMVPNDEGLASFVAATGKTPAAIARVALLRLRAVARDPSSSIGEFSAHMDMLMWLAHGRKGILREAVVQEDGGAILTKSLLALMNRPDLGTKDVATAISLNFCVMKWYLKTRSSVHAMRCAIRSGLFVAYAKLTPVFKDYHMFHQQNILAVMKEALSHHLVYSSVVNQAIESAGDFIAGRPWEAVAEPQLKFALLCVSRLVSVRGMFMREWDAMKHMAHCNSCEARFLKVDLKACGQCHAVLYCSKACQAAAWVTHKKTCALRRRIASRELGGPSKADWIYLRQLALYDARGAQGRLHPVAAEDLPGVPLSDIGISLDYRTDFPTVKLFQLGPAATCLRDDGPDSDNMVLANNLMEQARTRAAGCTLVMTETALGNGKRLGIVLVSPSIWDTEDMEYSEFRVVDAAWMEDGV